MVENDFRKWVWQQIIVGSGHGLYPDLLTEPVHGLDYGLAESSVRR